MYELDEFGLEELKLQLHQINILLRNIEDVDDFDPPPQAPPPGIESTAEAPPSADGNTNPATTTSKAEVAGMAETGVGRRDKQGDALAGDEDKNAGGEEKVAGGAGGGSVSERQDKDQADGGGDDGAGGSGAAKGRRPLSSRRNQSLKPPVSAKARGVAPTNGGKNNDVVSTLVVI